ncbi:alkaline phosphatase family protein [Huintestinicola sp.]|uniref:alkaline phosphatase family protein n=1 Tax=Huintestinicola sp. TaxID=2981661 RepID=UPI003D7D068B
MNIKYPDYKNSIANLACSVLKYYGIEPPNPTLPQADRLLNRPYKNVVIILLDGMGASSVEKHLSPKGFFRKHFITKYSSTFPSTTVAATTAMDSGLFPNQSAWLGWTGYFEELDRNIVYFFGTDGDTGEQLDINAAWTYVPYENIRDRISKTGVTAHYLAKFWGECPQTYSELCGNIKRHCLEPNRNYIYAYWDEPDCTMHKSGVDGEEIKKLLMDMEKTTEQLAADLDDTLLIVTADHGHINIKNNLLTDYPDLTECLVRMPSMEPRALNLFVKDGMKDRFKSAFNEHFGDEFILLTKEELLQKQLLGSGQNHPKLERMLGDFLAIAIGDMQIVNSESRFKGSHAGLTEDEMTIPLIAISK